MLALRPLGWILGAAVVALASAAPAEAQEASAWRAFFQGVSKTAAPGTPGPLAVYGRDAFPLITGKLDGDSLGVVVAGARLGQGRIVAFGHDGYFDAGTLQRESNGAFVVNAVKWCAGPGKTPDVGVLSLAQLQAHLSKSGIAAAPIAPDARNLRRHNVLAVTHNQLTEELIAKLEPFVRRGGGLLIASTGWGWAQITRKPISEHPCSRLTAPAGIVWTDLTVSGGGRPTEHSAPPSDLLHARTALAAIQTRRLTPAEIRQAVATCRTALAHLPAEETAFRSEVKPLTAAAPTPTAAKPIRAADGKQFAALALSTAEAATAPVSAIKAHPAAASFPGTANAAPVSRTVAIDRSHPGWASTGLYALPGAAIRVTVPVARLDKPWKVRIGAHTDTLWHVNSWRRAPAVAREFAVKPGVTEAANAFGGPVYLEVPDGATPGVSQVTIEGAIEAPYYQLGQTTPRQWRNSIRNRPGPWAELAGRKVILTLPSSAIRGLEDPRSVMEFWDQVVETQEQFISHPGRPRLERLVADVQVGYGYMHAGYPIVVPTDETMTRALNPPLMREKGNWGYFHELGHNLQHPDWTFEGTGEVTNNVLGLYAYEKVLGKGFDAVLEHAAIAERQRRAADARKYVQEGSPFQRWKAEPFLALLTYMELRDKFGWEPFQAVFKEYQSLPAAERPKDDQQKRDQFMLRFSRAVNTRLDLFFQQRWGIPLSAGAAAEAARIRAVWRGPTP